MSKSLPLITNAAASGETRKRTINPLVGIGPVSLRILTIASAASLLLFYLAQTTQSATKSYEVQALGSQRDELLEEVDRLELEAQRLQSLGAIREGLSSQVDQFEEAGTPKSLTSE